MLPIKKILKDPKDIEKKLRSKDPSISLKELIESYQNYTEHLTKLEKLKENLNSLSKQIGEKKRSGEDSSDVINQVTSIKTQIKDLQSISSDHKDSYEARIAALPNLPDEDIKISLNPEENVCIKTVGENALLIFLLNII